MKTKILELLKNKKIVAIASSLIAVLVLAIALVVFAPWDKETLNLIPEQKESTDVVENDLVNVYLGEVDADLILSIKSDVQLTSENIKDYIAVIEIYGAHKEGSPVVLQVKPDRDSLYSITGNYASPGKYEIVLKSNEVQFDVESKSSKEHSITESVRLVAFDVTGESFENIVYSENIKEVQENAVLSFNGQVVGFSKNSSYQAGDIVSLTTEQGADYYKLTEVTTVENPADNAVYFKTVLANPDEVFSEMEAYVHEVISEEDLTADIKGLEENIKNQLLANEELESITDLMIESAGYTPGYRKFAAKYIGGEVQAAAPSESATNGVSVEVEAGIKNAEFAKEMSVPADTEFLKLTAIVQKDITLQNAKKNAIVISADVCMEFYFHLGFGGYANKDGAKIDFDAHANTYTHTSISFNLEVATQNKKEVINITDEFNELMQNAEDITTAEGVTLFEKYSGIIGDTESNRITLCEQQVAAPMTVIGVVEVAVPIDLVVSVDMHAALVAELDVMTTNQTGVCGNTSDGIMAYSYYGAPSVEFSIRLQEHADVRAGVRPGIRIGFVGFARYGNVMLSAELGPYVDFYGFYALDYYKHGVASRMSVGGAYYLETGIYLDVDLSATVLTYKLKADIIDAKWKLATLGSSDVLYGFAYNNSESIVMNTNEFQLDEAGVLDVLYFDLTEPMSESNPSEGVLKDFRGISVSFSNRNFAYDSSTRTVYFAGVSEAEKETTKMYIRYLNSSATFQSVLKLTVNLTYWNSDKLGEYDSSKVGETYTVSYMLNNNVYKTEEIKYGTRLYGSGVWHVTDDPNDVYERVKWDHGNPIIVGDTIIDNGTGELKKTAYDFVCINKDGVTQTTRVESEYGIIPSAETIDALKETQSGYRFAGWYQYTPSLLTEVEPSFSSEVVTYYAIYEPIPDSYKVTFDLAGGKMSDGRTVVEILVEEGQYAPIIDEPILVKGDGKNYAFVEWTPAFAPITADTTYTAVYEEMSPIENTEPDGSVVTGVQHKFENGVLTISGTGKIGNYLVDYAGQQVRPWDNNYDKITKIVIEAGITYVGNHAFSYLPNLTSIEMADSVTTAGFACFMDCPKLTDVKLSKNLKTRIEDEQGCDSMFSGCTSLKTITLPAGFEKIPMQMFHTCTSLQKVNLSNGLKLIDWGAFGNCTSLKSITLPNSITEIGTMAFYGCTSLESINLSDNMVIAEDAFEECPKLQ